MPTIPKTGKWVNAFMSRKIMLFKVSEEPWKGFNSIKYFVSLIDVVELVNVLTTTIRFAFFILYLYIKLTPI